MDYLIFTSEQNVSTLTAELAVYRTSKTIPRFMNQIIQYLHHPLDVSNACEVASLHPFNRQGRNQRRPYAAPVLRS